MSVKFMGILHRLTHVYQKYLTVKVIFGFIAACMCVMLLTSSQVSLWMPHFQKLAINMSHTTRHLSADTLFLVINSSETTVYQTSNIQLPVTTSSVLLLGNVPLSPTNITNTKNINLNQVKQMTKVKTKEGCTFPNIDPLDPAIMALVKIHSPINCNWRIPNLVYLEGNIIKVNHSKMAYFENKNTTFQACRMKSLDRKRGTDFKTVVMKTSGWFNDSISLNNDDDNLLVECFNDKKVLISRSYFPLIHPKKDLEILLDDNLKKHISKNAPKEVLSVLYIGIDGNSKQNFQRMMPKTRNFLLNNLTAVELHKYNTVGGQTYTNVVPMLTGHHPSEFKKVNWTTKQHFDAINDYFLWSDFRKAGYRTGIMLDSAYITSFHYLKKGWNKPPVDYYLRATVLQMEKDKLMRNLRCVGDIPEITLNHNFWIQLASTFNNSQRKPYFGYSFSQRLTHDDLNKASAADELYLAFLQEMVTKNIINNTLIIFFSDHGGRFGKIRSTYNGFIESRTPYVFLVFPPWFHKKYPDLIRVLKINQERLTTNFDLYETVRDVLNFQAVTGYGNIKERGISLFKEIPPERTCEHADVPKTYCICTPLTPSNISSNLTQALATAVLHKLYNLIGQVRDKCTQLSLKSVQNVMVFRPAERDSTNGRIQKAFYQIMLTTTPGEAIYEARLTHYAASKTIKVSGEVTRLNMYRGQAECVNDSTLRQFCFCKK